jgi:methyl-accepting chemotaxis protein
MITATPRTDTSPTAIWDGTTIADTLGMLSSPIMLADKDMVIRYVNEAAYQMFQAIETDIKLDLPHFDARNVVGKNIDVFHKNPIYQRRLMEGMKAPHDGSFRVGGKDLVFRASPRFSTSGDLVSIMVEWKDMTIALEAKRQIEDLIARIKEMAEAHLIGRINEYIDPTRYNADFADLASRINAMVKDHIETKKKIISCASAYASGNFAVQIERYTYDRAFITEAMDGIRDSFLRVVTEIKNLSNSIVEGRLDRTIDPSGYQGEFLEIIRAFSEAYDKLNEDILTVRSQMDQVATTVDQISTSAQSLAASSQVASSSIDELSASSEQTSIQVKSNAEAAEEARKLIMESSSLADQGRDKMTHMVESMTKIEESARDISKIIKVIDEIAFQTNLLALNAAVEAARAGQHGRGFAVVAQEVRNLAGRSAKAARETSDLIETSSNNVREGVSISTGVQQAFDQIANTVKKSGDLVTGISTASQEQSKGVTQINLATSELAREAVATSAQADQLAAASAEMNAATEAVKKALKMFKLRERKQSKEIDLSSLSPEMLQKLIAMMPQDFSLPSPPPALNVESKNVTYLDRDSRGYANF